MSLKNQNIPENYFKIRDYEYAQYIYDLAYLLEIGALSEHQDIPKFRIKSLFRAAYSIDGYSTKINQFVNGNLDSKELDYVPSNRIKKYLTSLNSDDINKLFPNELTSVEIGCLRLRPVKGIRKSHISNILKEKKLSSVVVKDLSAKSNISENDIKEFFNDGSHGQWQAAHIVPPLLRFLQTIESSTKKRPKWLIRGIKDGINPVSIPFIVEMYSRNFVFDESLIKILIKKNPLFSLKKISEKKCEIRHMMGWHFKINILSKSNMGSSINELVFSLDPLVHKLPCWVKSDLHLHTVWSDGTASIEGMVQAAKKYGLEYVAITDHSRSCKLQGGLGPASWLRQAMYVKKIKTELDILHGLEVDILKNGDLDIPDGILEGMDIVIGSIHTSLGMNSSEVNDRLIKAIESGRIDIIAHPSAAIIGKPGDPNYIRPSLEIDWDKIFNLCAKWRVALEINCFPSRLDLSSHLLKKAIDAGCWISLGSDAHSRSHMDLLKFGVAVLNKTKTHNILNSLSYQKIKIWLKEARDIRHTLPRTKKETYQPVLIQHLETTSNKNEILKAHYNKHPKIPDGSDVVGLDITAGKNKKTGVALLSGQNVETTSLLTDEELLDYISFTKPAIVSIDSPLGFPGGGKKIKSEAGIVRVAEHHLSSVGIPAYPALIDSMKGLTMRGIRLKKMIESIDNPPTVIESYPGAAQDLLCIPRKQKGLDYLRLGLRDLGLKGAGMETTSHDEMDAITCCIVGRFFEKKMYEPMGIPSEAQLIVPTTPVLTFMKQPVVCLSGKSGVGKSVIARYLTLFYGFHWIKTRDLILKLINSNYQNIASKLKINTKKMITEKKLKNFGQIILDDYDQIPLRELLINEISRTDGPVVVDSIRSINDLAPEALKDKAMLIWHISCPDSVLAANLLKQKKEKLKTISLNEAIDRNVRSIKDSANSFILNESTLENLHWAIDDILFSDVITL